MGTVIAKGACPAKKCGSHDAYMEYADGGGHCFSCGYHKPANGYKVLLANACIISADRGISLPDSRTYDLPKKAVDWLRKYSITDEEIDRHNICYSMGKELLVFPVYSSTGQLVMWQGRYFGDNKKHPKYITRGEVDSTLHIIGAAKADFIVLTEDLISSIKVGRHYPAMPLWGSFLSFTVARRLAVLYRRAKLFLDYDKRTQSMLMATRNSHLLKITPVIERLDPKEYTDTELVEILS